MRYIKCLFVLILFLGCERQKLSQEQKQSIRSTKTKISCLTPEGWKDYWPRNSDPFYKGGWNFYNLEGERIQSSMCQRVFKLKTRKVK